MQRRRVSMSVGVEETRRSRSGRATRRWGEKGGRSGTVLFIKRQPAVYILTGCETVLDHKGELIEF